jgi:rhodanese-related sulfurtransferase
MPTTIDRNMLQRLVAEGAQLVEVLPPAEYDQEHLPGAMSLPLRQLTAETASTLRKDVPVITYCGDYT